MLARPALQEGEPAARSPAENAEDVLRQLRRELEAARAGLDQGDSGPQTRAAQKKVLDDLDRLIDQQRAPSPDRRRRLNPNEEPVQPVERKAAPKAAPEYPSGVVPSCHPSK